jgi:hypothetical protein
MLAIGVFLMINILVVPVLLKIKQDAISSYLKIHPFIFNNITIIIFLTLITELLIYLIYKKISQKIERKREIEYKTNKEIDKIEYLLSKDLDQLNYHQLEKLLNRLEETELKYISIDPYEENIERKIKEINHKLIALEQKRELEYVQEEIQDSREILEEMNAEIDSKKDKEEEKKGKIRSRLRVGYKDVFKKESLTKKEIQVIKEQEYNKYDAVNEYSVVEKRIIPVFVRQVQHHSATHTFLVWDVKNLLKRYKEIESIIDHETRNADITFRIKRKLYAIEIEKGSLLRKPKQLRQKVDFLNEEYGRRWIILISNRNLAKEYRKYGKVSTRKGLQKNIEKWIKEAKYS